MGLSREIQRIMVVEPQCWGLEHASINAPLVDTVLLAFPGAQVVFIAEEEHLGYVRAMMERHDTEESHRVEWRSADIVGRAATGWPRFALEWASVGRVLQEARTRRAQMLLFSSITNTGILALMLRLLLRPGGICVLAVMHGMLNRIVGRWPHKPWNWPLNLRAVLRLPQPPLLWYLVLGDSVYEALAQAQPSLVRRFRAIDLPTFPYDSAPDDVFGVAAPDKVIFGHLGVGNITKGFGRFARIAQDCRGSEAQAEFLLVGYLSSFRDNANYSCVAGVTEQPLSIEEYGRRAHSLTYVINTANPDDYRLAPSSSFVEALFYGKPGIYLRNRYVEHCFGLMGDIGYLCDTHEQMVNIVRGIMRQFPSGRYQQQVANIRKGRVMLEPRAVARRLFDVVGRCAG